MGFAGLSTPRLWLRPFRGDDAAALAAYRSDPAVALYQGWTLPYTLADAEALIESMQSGAPVQTGWYQIALEERASGRLVGDVALCGVPPGQAELGFTLVADTQGKGYATEALTALLDHAFGALSLHRVFAGIDPRNGRAAALLARLGFRHEGTALEAYWQAGAWTDDAHYALLAREWRATVPSGSVHDHT